MNHQRHRNQRDNYRDSDHRSPPSENRRRQNHRERDEGEIVDDVHGNDQRRHQKQHRHHNGAPRLGAPARAMTGRSEGLVGSHGGSNKSRKRPRDEKREAERRERMARLRAENEHEDGDGFQRSIDGNHTASGKNDELKNQELKDKKNVDEEQDDEENEEEAQLKKMLGISGFGSTKGEKVQDNHSTSARGAAAKHKARKYRQYMNRKNGFNRPLDHMD